MRADQREIPVDGAVNFSISADHHHIAFNGLIFRDDKVVADHHLIRPALMRSAGEQRQRPRGRAYGFRHRFETRYRQGLRANRSGTKNRRRRLARRRGGSGNPGVFGPHPEEADQDKQQQIHDSAQDSRCKTVAAARGKDT